MTAKNILLRLNPNVGFIKCFALVANKKSQTLAVYLDGKYGDKCVISSVSITNWKKTQHSLREALKSKGVNDNDIDLTMDVLDNNNDIILGNMSDRGGTTESATETESTEAAEQRREEELIQEILERIETLREENKNIDYETWRIELMSRFNTLHEVVNECYPDLWEPLKFCLVVRTILDIEDITIPFIGLLLGPPGSSKTAALETLMNVPQTVFTDHFTPPALVSHNASIPREQLEKNDLLPRMKNNMLLTPEMGPTFTEREEILNHWCGIISRVADGGGYRGDSGVYAKRGYSGEYMFVWVGAVVHISHQAYKYLATTGFKLYFLRLWPRTKSRDQKIDRVLTSREHKANNEKIRRALINYLGWFKICPLNKEESDKGTAACKIPWKAESDETKEGREVIGICTDLGDVLRSLRGYVETYKRSSEDTDYPTTTNNNDDNTKKYIRSTEFEYDVPILEEPDRASFQLFNYARANALTTEGRNWLVKEKDLPMIIRVALSTCTYARTKIFRLLVEKDGVATTSQIADRLGSTPHKAKRTMVELKACGLVTMKRVNPAVANSEYQITLKSKFNWVLEDEFKRLRELSRDMSDVEEEDDSEVEEEDE